MQSLDLFAEFANAPPVATAPRAANDRPNYTSKMLVVTDQIRYEQWGKELRITAKKNGRYERTKLRGLIYPTLLENLYWRFKIIGLQNAHQFVTYHFMRKIITDAELLDEKQRIDEIVHSRCKDGDKCRHINNPTWSEHLNELVRHATHSD